MISQFLESVALVFLTFFILLHSGQAAPEAHIHSNATVRVLQGAGTPLGSQEVVLPSDAPGTTTITMEMPGVQPNQRESYLCKATPINSDKDNFIIKFLPRASRQTVHHMILFGCRIPGNERDVWNCGAMHTTTVLSQYPAGPVCLGKQLILYAWAMDAPGLDLPEGVGFKVGGRSGLQYLVLQVHYLEPLQQPDHSGLSVQMTASQLPKSAGVVVLSTGGKIRAHTKEKFEAACYISDNVELHPFAFRVHTHRLGKVVSGYVVSARNWHLLGKRDPQEPQMFYPVANSSVVLRRGDMLASRCTMENLLDDDVYVGPTSNDEMCNFYVMYWANGDSTLNRDWCGTAGPPIYYWSTDRAFARSRIPDQDASTLP